MTEVTKIRALFHDKISSIKTSNEIESLRIEFLGKNGIITSFLKAMNQASSDEKREYGQKINTLKQEVVAMIDERLREVEERQMEEKIMNEYIDYTLPSVRSSYHGAPHPMTKIQDRIRNIFLSMGLTEANVWNEIDDEFHNFTALNIPDNHPARDMHDTFYISKSCLSHHGERFDEFAEYSLLSSINPLLRTHTSTTEIRDLTTRENATCAKIFSMGKTYRADYDSTHLPMFTQVECMYLGSDITIAKMKWFIEDFLYRLFREKIELRFRSSYFPFTEPSMEVDMRAKDGRWLELMGCGMLHRNVLKHIEDIRRENGAMQRIEDWSDVRGFAFGGGIERIAMILYGIDDIRSLYINDNRWIKHYSNCA